MKKILLLFVVFSALNLSSQSIQVIDDATQTNVTPNMVIATTTTATAQTKITFDIKNTSAVTNEYNVKRYDIVLNGGGAEALFCFASYCYPSITTSSPNSLTLTAGQKASDIQGAFQMLDADFNEGTAVGYSYIKYTFVNKNVPSDSVQFSIQYNSAMSVNELKNSISAVDVYPNPVFDNATLNIVSATSKEVKVNIYNALGSAISEKYLVLTEGKNKIDLNTSSLSPGIYFASVKTGNNTITKKFIVK